MGHILGHLIQKTFLALGGLVLWMYALLAYHFLSKDISTDIGYYLFEEFDIENKSGFTINGIRFFIGILAFIAFIIALDHYE